MPERPLTQAELYLSVFDSVFQTRRHNRDSSSKVGRGAETGVADSPELIGLPTTSTPPDYPLDLVNLFPPPSPSSYPSSYYNNTQSTADVLTFGFRKASLYSDISTSTLQELFDSNNKIDGFTMPFDSPPPPLASTSYNLAQIYNHDSFAVTTNPASTHNNAAISFDRLLDSPLGLDSPHAYSGYEYSPLFDDLEDGGEDGVGSESTPGLDESGIPPSLRNRSLFPSTSTSGAPSPPPTPFQRATYVSPDAAPLNAPPRLPETRRARAQAAKPPVPTGFRGSHTPLLSVEAPIQPRSYAAPSATSRKRRASSSAISAHEQEEEELSDSTLSALEKKRKQNTISARKSRMRKQARLDELEEENASLKAAIEAMRERIQELEQGGEMNQS